MATVLLINPNTSDTVTRRMADSIAPVLPAGATLVHRTARFGAAYIASETAYAIAAHAVLDAWAAHMASGADCDLVIVGCFGDPGVAALRELAGVPVIGLAEAALREAAAHGPHAIVTGGAAWKPMLERFAAAQDLAQGLQGIHIVERSGVALMAQPDGGAAEILQALLTAAQPSVRALIIGGAALAGIAQRVASQVPVPVIDSVQAGARWAADRLAQGLPPVQAQRDRAVTWAGVSEALLGALA